MLCCYGTQQNVTRVIQQKLAEYTALAELLLNHLTSERARE